MVFLFHYTNIKQDTLSILGPYLLKVTERLIKRREAKNDKFDGEGYGCIR